MKQVILIHGAPYEDEFYNVEKPSPSNTNWFPWLQKQIALNDGLCQALEFPKPFDPIYDDWKKVFEQMAISNETILVGHSCGGGFLLRYLSEHKNIQPKQVILVAPWLDPEPHELTTNFFNFEIDNKLSERTNLHIFESSDDFEGCLKSFQIIESVLPNATYHKFDNREHFTDKEFPELRDLILKDA